MGCKPVLLSSVRAGQRCKLQRCSNPELEIKLGKRVGVVGNEEVVHKTSATHGRN